jgi:histidine triad (HIT) family protein
MSSLFTKIIRGEIPCYKVAEDAQHIAFLDIQPLKEGHVLVVPKEEVDYYFDLQPEAMSALSLFTQKVAVALKKAIPCRKVAVSIIGIEVPHVHVHLVPLDSIAELNFSSPRAHFTPAEFEATAQRIASYFEA